MRKGFYALALSMFAFAPAAYSQEASDYVNPIITAVPSQSIAPDARGGSMGDLGVATSADLYSQYWNAAKYPFTTSNAGVGVSYTPWLRKLIGEIDLVNVNGYYRFDDVQAVSASFRYFSMGKISLTDQGGNFFAQAKPNEFSIDAAYSRKLSEHFSMAVAFRFIYSDLNNGQNSSTSGTAAEMFPGWALAADVSGFYDLPIMLSTGDANFRFGFNLSNLGSKVTYNKIESNFIPANFRLGAGFEFPFDDYNRLSVNLEANKLLVPSQKSRFTEGFDKDNSSTWDMSQEQYSSISSVKGWFWSFADAPNGFVEELQEIMWGVGVEYSYNRQFFVRAGYSNESKYKGNRKYFTVGAGFKLSMFELDAGYVISVANNNPLDGTLRFTLGFDLEGLKNLVDR